MSLKTIAKKSLKALGLLGALQQVNYQLSFLDKKSNHPRKLVFLFYRQFIGQGSLVFDVGANIGDRVAVFNELGAKIVAVEPQTHCVAEIRKRFGNHPNVFIENVGLGESKGEMDFFICDEDDRLSTFSNEQMENSFFSGNTKWNRKEVIKVLTMEDLIAKYGIPSFCKIDVEGYEPNVLKGLKTPIPAISFEFSSKQLDKVQECMSLLTAINADYRFNIGFGEPYALHFKSWVQSAEVIREVEQKDRTSPTHAWGDIYVKLIS